MSENNEKLTELEVELLRQQIREQRKQIIWLRKFNISHWVVGVLGLIIFSQAVSFGRWNNLVSAEANFNNHSLLIAGCGLALIFIATAAYALHKRLQGIEKYFTNKL